jgi:hypothetical protein
MQKSRNRLSVLWLLFSAFPARATPPPPDKPPQLREARMTATVRLIEASKGKVSKITELCKVSGKIPVYADDGSAAHSNAGEISGCKMHWKGKHLNVSVQGAMAIAKGAPTYAVAIVSVVPPDAVPLCSICGPQPLADSSAEIRIRGTPKSLSFSLAPNPVSILNSKPTVWLEADIEVVD